MAESTDIARIKELYFTLVHSDLRCNIIVHEDTIDAVTRLCGYCDCIALPSQVTIHYHAGPYMTVLQYSAFDISRTVLTSESKGKCSGCIYS